MEHPPAPELIRIADWLALPAEAREGHRASPGENALVHWLSEVQTAIRLSVHRRVPDRRIPDAVMAKIRLADPRSSASQTSPVAIPVSHVVTRIPVGAPRKSWIMPGLLGAAVAFAVAIGVARHIPFISAKPQVYVTSNGQRATVELNDGTRVTLNVGSRLEVPARFGASERQITLSGEAFFSVAHAAGTPFTVRTGKTETKVLGTEFAIQAYATDSSVQVAVNSGKVSLNGVPLTARQIGRVQGTRMTIVRDTSVQAALSFARGELVLSGRPLREVVPQLERWYDVKLRFGTPSIGDQRLEATLGVGSATDLIQTLEFALKVRVEVHGNELRLYAN